MKRKMSQYCGIKQYTDREVRANRPDIIIKNKKEKTCTLIDVAIPADRNVVQREAEKRLKCKSLCIEIKRMWNLKCTIIPVIIGATGIVTRSLRKKTQQVQFTTVPLKTLT
jgi:23S rRNA pseudoU1915 N3-methylase RlmH